MSAENENEGKEKSKKGDARPDINDPEMIQRRVDQMSLNFMRLLDRLDAIHHYLCPGQSGTWQRRAEQAEAAAKEIANRRGK